VKIPDRETARVITWMTDGLLSSGGHALPAGLMAALREYKSALLANTAGEPWAQPGHRARYATLADLIERELADGKWQPGERLPSDAYFAETHGVNGDTVERALHVLTVRGRLALEHHSYYVLPRDMV
jgi:hypothetical protein